MSTNPSTVIGGNLSSATVVMSVGAPDGGAVIALTSSHPAIATVPATSTVPTAQFTTVGAQITLTASDGRDAIWSGACSSNGSKRKTCAFTLNANASVTANVQ
jgi:hypothetical protein